MAWEKNTQVMSAGCLIPCGLLKSKLWQVLGHEHMNWICVEVTLAAQLVTWRSVQNCACCAMLYLSSPICNKQL